ncbi:MAG: hypothetical protein EBX50_18020 [Chitinophagia bacterium]|nr:hypothetical protein [Chitinophagia bacterium]
MFYKKYTNIISRTKFSKQIRKKGNGYIPIVIDSYDIDISKSLNMCLKNTSQHDPDCVGACTRHDPDLCSGVLGSVQDRKTEQHDNYTYGVEIPFYIDSTIEDLKNYIYKNEYIHDYIQNIKNYDLVHIEDEYESDKDPDLSRPERTQENYTNLDNKNIILKNNDIIGNLYKKYKDKDDNILYIYLLRSKSNIIISIGENCNIM